MVFKQLDITNNLPHIIVHILIINFKNIGISYIFIEPYAMRYY